MRITLPHRFDFGDDRALVGDDLLRPEAWDGLRLETSGPFAVPSDLDAAADAHPELRDRVAAVCAEFAAIGARSVVSYGVGTAIAERWIERLAPDLELVLTEYAPGTVARLQEISPEADIRVHDLLDGPLPADVHLFHRIDTELANHVWRDVYAAFAGERVVVVAAEVKTYRELWRQWRRLRRMPDTVSSAGWARSRAALEALWRPTHEARRFRAGDLWAWSLAPRSAARRPGA